MKSIISRRLGRKSPKRRRNHREKLPIMNPVEFVKLRPCCSNETTPTCDGSPLLYRRFVRDDPYGSFKENDRRLKGPLRVLPPFICTQMYSMKLRLLVNGNVKKSVLVFVGAALNALRMAINISKSRVSLGVNIPHSGPKSRRALPPNGAARPPPAFPC